MRRRGIRPWLFSLAAATALHPQGTGEPWTLSGFGTFALASTGTHQVGYVRDYTQPYGVVDHPEGKVDTRLGLQYGGRFSDSLYGTVQVISKYRYDGTFRPEVNSAFLGWNPVASLDIRAGRLNVEFNLAGNSRDVGYSFLYVRPPVEFYAKNATNKFLGVDVASTFALAAGRTLRLKAWGGKATEEKLPLNTGETWDISGNEMYGLIADLQAGPWRAKASWEAGRFANNFPPSVQVLPDGLVALAGQLHEPKLLAVAASLQVKGKRPQTFNAALAYESGSIQAQMELSRGWCSGPLLPNTWTGYGCFGYRLGEVVPYGLFSRVVNNHTAPPDLGVLAAVPGLGALVAAAVNDLIYVPQNNQNTVAAGLRWDFRPGAALKFQMDRIQAYDSDGLWHRLQPGWDGKATVFTVSLDFVFGGGR